MISEKLFVEKSLRKTNNFPNIRAICLRHITWLNLEVYGGNSQYIYVEYNQIICFHLVSYKIYLTVLLTTLPKKSILKNDFFTSCKDKN